jgi:hypothetical protein
MKTFIAIVAMFICVDAYGGCPGGICPLKKSPTTTVVTQTSNVTSTATTTTTKTKRGYRVSKWR